LTPEEILIALRSGGDGLDKERQAHIDQCPDCAQIKEEYKAVLSKFYEFGRAGRSISRSDCYPASVWAGIAAGLSTPDETLARLKHASSCRSCAEELENALAAIGSSEPPAQEIAQHLETGTRDWQQKFAVQMSAHGDEQFRAGKSTPIPASKSQPIMFRPKTWVYVGLAAVAAVAIGLGILSRLRSSSPEQLIAQAYSQQRTIELRIPGAGYGPIQVERASRRSQSNSPAALLEAESIIRRQMEKTPQDPELLREKAEADLLNWDYQPAIETLGQALRLRPNSFYLLVDLATAHFERAEASSDPADYEAGLQYLGDAIRIEPNNPAALFNRAIVYERLYLYGRAIADWEQFLKVEKDPGWRKEAEQRLQELRSREHQRSLRHAPERLTLAQFKDDLKTKQAAGIEEYLEVAERQILPNISASRPQDESYQAATALANVLKSEHDDPFLTDLLQTASRPTFHGAVKLLGQASSANHDGRAEEAYGAATQAAGTFQRLSNVAGLLASRFEQAYALQFESRASSCQTLASEAVDEAHRHGYAALEVQLLLEQAICSNMDREVGPAKSLTQRSLALAKIHNLQSFYLRGLSLLATLESDAGNESGAWSAIHEGLSLYWKSSLPPVRAYSAYVTMERLAERLGHPNVRFAAVFEAMRFRSESTNHVVEASERMRLVNAAIQLGETQVAESQAKQAQQLFAEAPQTESVRWLELEAQINLARVQALRGTRAAETATSLLVFLPEVERLSNRYVEFQYYDTLADLKMSSGDTQAGRHFLASAIRIADDGLQSLPAWGERLAWTNQHRQPYMMLTELLLRSGDQQSALDTWEHFRTATASTLPKPVATVRHVSTTEAQLSSKTPPYSETRTLTYAFSPGGLMIWVRWPSEIHGVFLAVPPRDLRRAAENFIGECARPDSDLSNLRSDAHYLYTWLIQPISQWLPTSGHMVVEPDGILAVVPMEALMDPAGAYLGTRYTITIASSLRASDSASQAAVIRASDRALIVAAPTRLDGSLEPPAGAMAEARGVAERFLKPTVLAGGEARVSRVEMELRRNVVFHFAGHAGLTRDGAVMLMADGPLGAGQARSFAGHNLSKLKLVVFSACGTAKPSETSESDSLVNEFLQASAQNVVASRWNVDSMATADFVEVFYGAVLSGSSVANALQTAANAFRKTPERSHPYYWAAFSAFGKA